MTDVAGEPGLFEDGFSWRHPLAAPIGGDALRHFRIDAPGRQPDGRNPGQPLVRMDHLSVYARAFEEGSGEDFLHVHEDEASWLVLEGEARFVGRDGAELARVRSGEGVAIPPGTAYRFTCPASRSLLLRVAAR